MSISNLGDFCGSFFNIYGVVKDSVITIKMLCNVRSIRFQLNGIAIPYVSELRSPFECPHKYSFCRSGDSCCTLLSASSGVYNKLLHSRNFRHSVSKKT